RSFQDDKYYGKLGVFKRKVFFMMVFILRKQSYADFICDEACVLESVFLWFFLQNNFTLSLLWNFKLYFFRISNPLFRSFQDDKCAGKEFRVKRQICLKKFKTVL
uniref:hypothetical protein n=1 Tax=uncultured Chryseobacterium sp. TaxID=259322 RepID=UPI00374A2A9F